MLSILRSLLRIGNSHHYLHFNRRDLNRSILFTCKTVTKVYTCIKACLQCSYKVQEEEIFKVLEAVNAKGFSHIDRKTSHKATAGFVDSEYSKDLCCVSALPLPFCYVDWHHLLNLSEPHLPSEGNKHAFPTAHRTM